MSRAWSWFLVGFIVCLGGLTLNLTPEGLGGEEGGVFRKFKAVAEGFRHTPRQFPVTFNCPSASSISAMISASSSPVTSIDVPAQNLPGNFYWQVRAPDVITGVLPKGSLQFFTATVSNNENVECSYCHTSTQSCATVLYAILYPLNSNPTQCVSLVNTPNTPQGSACASSETQCTFNATCGYSL